MIAETLHVAQIELGAQSPAMRTVVNMADRVAAVDSTVLLTGESGVGKERLAQYIHGRSERRKAPFVAINCGALTPTLLESELFGHRKGAFTGAHLDRPGLFEAAHTGSVFLDEIGEMPVDMQTALLRVVQEREVRRLGDTQVRRVNVRVLAATNKDLKEEARAHRFRWDLYYRLSVIVIRIPPLRERPDDLEYLLHHVLATTTERLARPAMTYTPRALTRLRHHTWPGNIRELQNAIEYACVMAQADRIDLDDLPEQLRAAVPADEAPPFTYALADVERQHILHVLHLVGGNRRLAAERLKINLTTLHRKLVAYRRQGWTSTVLAGMLTMLGDVSV